MPNTARACLCWGIDDNLTRKLSSSDPVQIAILKGMVAGAVNSTLALWQAAMLSSPPLSLAQDTAHTPLNPERIFPRMRQRFRGRKPES
jgi:hypothetical protein